MTAGLALSPEDRARVGRVEALARSGTSSVSALIALLIEPSWAVRRAVVTALASAGDTAVDGLRDVLLTRRDHEGRLAATVDALVASRGAVDQMMMELAAGDTAAPVICDAVQVLGRRRTHAAVPLLARLSSHADDNVAVGSIEALGRIGGIETLDALIAAVEARRFFRTFPAIDALGRIGDARAVRSLVGLLGDPPYAPEAARALGRTGQESAVAPLAALLVQPTAALVRAAAVALADLRGRYEARFGDTDVLRTALTRNVDPALASRRVVESLPAVALSELAAVALVLGWLGDEMAVGQLLEMVTLEAPAGPAAIEALRRLGPSASPRLLAAIRDGDSALRLRLLPISGYASASLDAVLRCLEDVDADVRVRACEALARLGNTAAVSSLFRFIGDRDARMSQSASAAIQSLGSLETKRLALDHARSTDSRTRRAALRIVSYFGYPEGLDVLVDAMKDEDEKIREAAIYGLPLVDDPRGTEALLSSAAHEAPRTRSAVMRALGQTSSIPSVVAALRSGLSDEDPWVRYYACQSLGRLGLEAAAAEIVALLGDASGQVRMAAVEALAHLHDPRALQALSDAARSEDADLRRAALLGLGIARRPEAVTLLREAAGAADSATRLVAIGALAEFDGPEIVPILASAASDPDEAVRSAAIGYLGVDERIDDVLAALEISDAARAPLLVAALARMRRASGEAAIASALSFENIHARRAAASALAAVGTVEARDALVRHGSADPDPDVRRICAAAVDS